MSLIYFPVFSITTIIGNSIKKNNLEVYKNYFLKASNLSKNQMFSYAYRTKDDFVDYNIEKLFGDSGGFQILKYKNDKLSKSQIIDITSKKVLEWLEINCNWGMNLDIPPIAFNIKGNYDSFFKECLDETIENTKYFYENRTSNKLQLFNSLHGLNYEYLKKWYDKINKYKFEGWGINLRPINPIFLILKLLFLDEQLKNNNDSINNYRIHILGTDSLSILFIMGYFRLFRNKIISLSYDSSSHLEGRIRSNILTYLDDLIIPIKIGFHSSLNKENINDINKIDNNILVDFLNNGLKFPCNCESCKIWNNCVDNEIINNDNLISIIGPGVSNHNMVYKININEKLNYLLKYNPSLYIEYMNAFIKRKNLHSSLGIARDICDEYFRKETSVEKLFQKYFYKIESKVYNMKSEQFVEKKIDNNLFI